MIEPVELKDFLLVFFTSAGIILFGAAYAICHTLSVLRRSLGFRRLGYVFYVSLLLCIVALSNAAHFKEFWLLLSLTAATGYFWAPRLLLKLTMATHHH